MPAVVLRRAVVVRRFTVLGMVASMAVVMPVHVRAVLPVMPERVAMRGLPAVLRKVFCVPLDVSLVRQVPLVRQVVALDLVRRMVARRLESPQRLEVPEALGTVASVASVALRVASVRALRSP
ncbi:MULTISPECIES: hypothetical protein [unclassified Kitasatospora]|uniref:hypothetical protein n=1 Tax=unclassified Kitasatospora TaxID=2633591 RepID=UPI0024768BF9|nr:MULTISPECIES: hypothetical protein [unclassified Kitasatospora]MDH6576036.1 hypothetical protein [Kitasatospora sp. MAP5-34]